MKSKLRQTQRLPSPESKFSFKVVKSVPVAAVVALYKAGGWWEEGASNRKMIPAVIKNSFAFVIARNSRGKVVGMGRVISDGFSDAYIQDVVVLPACRGQHVGEGIIRALVDCCQRKKILWIGLVAEPGTYPFYRKIGFKDKKGFQLMLFGQGTKK